MSGRKHHFIPQFLLRGFSAQVTKSGTSQVWFFRKHSAPILTATSNVFVERDFYGGDRNELDDIITADESKHDAFVRRMRSETSSRSLGRSEEAAALCAMMCVRGRWIRRVFERGGGAAVSTVVNQVSTSTGIAALLQEQVARNPRWLLDQFLLEVTRVVKRPLTPEEQFVVRRMAETVQEDPVRFVAATDFTDVYGAFRAVSVQMPSIAKGGHIQGLTKSLREGGALRSALSALQWTVHGYPKNELILGDSGPLFQNDRAETIGPLGTTALKTIHGVVFPISARHILVGHKDGPLELPDRPSLIRATAQWSLEAFAAAENNEQLRQLQAVLGENIESWLSTITEF